MGEVKVLHEWPGETPTVRYGVDGKGYWCMYTQYAGEWFRRLPEVRSPEGCELVRPAAENKRLREALEKVNADARDLKPEIQALNGEVRELMQERDALAAENAELIEDGRSLGQSGEKLAAQRDALAARCERLERALEGARLSTPEALAARCKRLEEALRKAGQMSMPGSELARFLSDTLNEEPRG